MMSSSSEAPEKDDNGELPMYDDTLPKYEDVIKTGNIDSLNPEDVQVSYSYPASVAGSDNSDYYINELNVYRSLTAHHVHVTVGCTNPNCPQQHRTNNQSQPVTEVSKCAMFKFVCITFISINYSKYGNG